MLPTVSHDPPGPQTTVPPRRAPLAAWWSAWQPAVLVAAGGTVALRLVTEWIALVSQYGVRFPHVVAHHPSVLVDVWARWDVTYYVSIARYGYAGRTVGPGQEAGSIAFGPTYPWSIRAVHDVTGLGWVAAAELISLVATLVGVALVYRLAQCDGRTPGDRTGRRLAGTAVAVLLAWPAAFFLLAPYPESMALAFGAGAYLAARRHRWLLAGLLGAGTAMTKYYLVLLVVPLAIEVWEAQRRRPAGRHARAGSRRRSDLPAPGPATPDLPVPDLPVPDPATSGLPASDLSAGGQGPLPVGRPGEDVGLPGSASSGTAPVDSASPGIGPAARTRSAPARPWWPWAAVVGPTVVLFGAWMVYQQVHLGDALAFERAQAIVWNRHLAGPWSSLWHAVDDFARLQFLDTGRASVVELFDFVTVVLVAVAAFSAARRIRRSYAVLLGLAWCVFTFQTFLMGEIREVLALSPFWVVLGSWTTGHPWRERAVFALFVPCGYYLVQRFVTGAFAG